MGFNISGLGLFLELFFNKRSYLTDSIVLVFDYIFLLSEIQISLKNFKEKTQMSKRLTYTIIGQLSTFFQNFIDPVGISLNKYNSYQRVGE